jgi:hypothetical protein
MENVTKKTPTVSVIQIPILLPAPAVLTDSICSTESVRLLIEDALTIPRANVFAKTILK